MPVHIESIQSDVSVEAEPAAVSTQEAGPRLWEQMDLLRQAQRKLAWDRARTSAEGFDD